MCVCVCVGGGVLGVHNFMTTFMKRIQFRILTGNEKKNSSQISSSSLCRSGAFSDCKIDLMDEVRQSSSYKV